MKFPQAKNMTLQLMPRIFILMICTALMAIAVSAQKLAPEANPSIDQCSNGRRQTPQPAPEPCTGSNWQNGNINESNSHYVEGDSVPFRITYGGLTPGNTYSLLLEWDTTKAGKSAYDYLTTFDRSYPVDNNPCSGVTGCTLLAGGRATVGIPTDPDVTGGFDRNTGTPADNIVQAPGVFTIFGASTLPADAPTTSVYGFSGSYAGDSTRTITVTFVAGPANDDGGKTNIVLAWGGHIARRFDWGITNSAIAISGSPYHMRTGGQDRSLKIDAVIFPAKVTIIKRVYTLDAFTPFASTFTFGFTSTGIGAAAFPTNFNLVDSDPTEAGGGSRFNDNIQFFGAAEGGFTITENQVLSGRFFPDPDHPLVCTELGGGVPPVVNTQIVNQRQVNIVPDSGEIITCTFTNKEGIVSAAPSSVSGRVYSSFGSGIGGVTVSLFSPATGTTQTRRTNQFGYYTFSDLPTGDFYQVTVQSGKRYSFSDDTRSFTLNDSISDLDFTANP